MITTKIETLTTTEAAVVAGVTLRNVNRSIDEKILPEILYEVGPNGGRQINVDACVFLSFYFESANRLTKEERLRIIATASKQLPLGQESALEKEWLIRQEFLTVDLAPFLQSPRVRQQKSRSGFFWRITPGSLPMLLILHDSSRRPIHCRGDRRDSHPCLSAQQSLPVTAFLPTAWF
jgi:hypothetical protein